MQLNVELPDDEIRKVKKDAIDMNTTLAEYASQSFRRFMSLPVAVRRAHFSERRQRKVYGRKIKA